MRGAPGPDIGERGEIVPGHDRYHGWAAEQGIGPDDGVPADGLPGMPRAARDLVVVMHAYACHPTGSPPICGAFTPSGRPSQVEQAGFCVVTCLGEIVPSSCGCPIERAGCRLPILEQ